MSFVLAYFRIPPRATRLAAALALLLAPAASPHPLGDFSINQYFILDGTAPAPEIQYLLDVAEIPSFTELDLLDTDYDSEITQAEVETYLDRRIPQLAQHLHLTVNGDEVPLTVTRHKLILLEGNGGMVVFNILLGLKAEGMAWPDVAPVTVTLSSENYPGEQGTRECLLLSGGRFTDSTATLPAEILGKQAPVEQVVLDATVYGNRDANFSLHLTPGAASDDGPAVEQALAFTWTSTARLAAEMGETGLSSGIASALIDSGFRAGMPGEAQPLVRAAGDVSGENFQTGSRQAADTLANRLMDRMSAIVRAKEIPPLLFGLGLIIALGLGMGHALAPGHGKTVMAAYLIGEQGTAWHAIILGIVVTITHTWSVILLGVVTLYFEGWLSEEQVNFWTGILSGAIIVAIGLILFRQRYQQFLAAHQGGAGAWRFFHGHDHGPDPELPAPVATGTRPTYRNILWLGVSGGVVPCPAALIVLLLALKVGRLAYGLALILAFSLGLALVLVVIGLMVVRASTLLQRRNLAGHPMLQLMPLGSAALITLLGGWVVVWTLLQFDVLRFG